MTEPREPPLGAGLFRALRALAVRPASALFLLLLGVYAFFYQAGGWNQNTRFDMVRAVVEHGTFVIDRYEGNTGDDSIKDGHYYCDKAPGASWLAIPGYWLIHQLAGAPDPVPPSSLAWAAWFCIVLVVSVPSALGATFLVRLLGCFGHPPPTAFVTALLYGLGTLALPYSTLLYGNQLSGSLLLIAFTLLVEVRHGAATTRARMVVVGLLLGYAVVTEYQSVLVGVPIALYGWFVAGLRRSWPAVAAGVLPIGVLALYHWVLFGSPTAFAYDYSVWDTPKVGWFMGIGEMRWDLLSQILFGEFRGLLPAAPWLAAAATGAILLVRRHRVEALVCVWAVAAFLWLGSSIPNWDGGWAPGPRYLVPMLPFLCALAAAPLPALATASKRGVQARVLELSTLGLFAMLAALSVANLFAATAVKPEVPTEHQRPYSEWIWPKFEAGELSVSTQSIDMIDNPPNAPRQAWNLGMKIGLEGHASLVPLLVWVAASLTWLGWLLVRRRARG